MMNISELRQQIENRVTSDGLFESGISGVKFFKCTESINCAPVIYEPSLTVILNGSKEAIWDGRKHYYDQNQYICCTSLMPVEAGAPSASKNEPLIGIYIALDSNLMTELIIDVESNSDSSNMRTGNDFLSGIVTADWDESFGEALQRLLQLSESRQEAKVLGRGRLRELYFTVLKSKAGHALRKTYGLGNEISRTIEFLAEKMHEPITIDELAKQAGMSRAVFHRKFKQTTSLTPIQFVKAMRLNSAAMKIATGTHVNIAALEVGYESSSQFSREFKRLYGQSPKHWARSQGSNELVRLP